MIKFALYKNRTKLILLLITMLHIIIHYVLELILFRTKGEIKLRKSIIEDVQQVIKKVRI